MSARTRRIAFLAVAVVSLIFGPIAGADDYKVKLVRPDKVGDQYMSSVTAKHTEIYVTTKNGDETDRKTETFTAACQGTVKILEVDTKTGLATRIRFQVEKMTKDDDELYPQGTVIIAKQDGTETSFDIDGDRPDEDHVEALNALLGTGRSNALMTATATATAADEPRQVGGSWPINVGKFPTGMYEEGHPVTTDAVKGERKLVSVKKMGGQDVMVVKTTITGEGIKEELPDGWTITDGTITSEASDVLPVDDKQPAVSSVAKLTVKITMAPPLGASKSIVTVKAERRSRRDPVDN
jgi:hypothetical protein